MIRRTAFLLLTIVGASVFAAPRPNILFCLADDWGWPHAGAYGDGCVKTPTFDRLAKEGALFNHAYVSSPSCTPCRNAFITGKYHWELGSGANLWSYLPVEHESFIHMLRDNGYVTGRTQAKTWGPGDISPWEKHHGDHPATKAYKDILEFLEQSEAKNRPFFFWLGTSDPHRGYKPGSGRESGIDISKVHLFPHYPDNEVVRSDIADYYFEVQRWDALVGSAVAELEKLGLLENTIVIMTGDNGMPFPRCKGNLYDSGVRMPFAVRWGKGVKGGCTIDDFISFVDIAPTLLEVSGTPVPKNMSGRSFLSVLTSGKSGLVDPVNRSSIIFGRERHTPAQEKPSVAGYPSRGLRNSDFLYIRNYEPDRWPAGVDDPQKANNPGNVYGDCDGGPTKDYIVKNCDRDDAHRRSYQLCFAKRPAEELYDVHKDPNQMNNLAANPEYARILETLRGELQNRLKKYNDPRAADPHYSGFDGHPYLGGTGKQKR